MNLDHLRPPVTKLFNDELTTTGIVVFAIFVGGLFTWIGFALFHYFRVRRLEKLPAILGDPKELLEQSCNLLQLGISERYVLKKVAWRMRLPQPACILLSPALLVQAAHAWQESHHFTPSRQWGLHHLDEIARRLYSKNLNQLQGETAE